MKFKVPDCPGIADCGFYGESQMIQAGLDNAASAEPFVPPYVSVDGSQIFTTDQVSIEHIFFIFLKSDLWYALFVRLFYALFIMIEQIWATRDDLIHWVKEVATTNGWVMVTVRSSSGAGKSSREHIMFACEKHGRYAPYKEEVDGTGTVKTSCPFRLKGRPTVKGALSWKLRVMNQFHNHEPARDMVGHNYAGRLNYEEKLEVAKLAKSFVEPKRILGSLKDKNPANSTTISQVYGFLKRYRSSTRGSLTEMQLLLKKFEGFKYVHFEREEPGSDVVRDVFWAHPDSMKLFNTFSYVVIMDCTYKTNRYRIPLLEIVGLTSTHKTFSVDFCYMASESTDHYVWALECMKSLIADNARLPKVIVTDRDLALLSASTECLPDATHLLCLFHINKCVLAKCKKIVGTDEFADWVMVKWKELVDAETEEQFQAYWTQLFEMCKGKYGDFTSYVSTTWLVHKEKFVKAWTNRVMHFGNTTSNR